MQSAESSPLLVDWQALTVPQMPPTSAPVRKGGGTQQTAPTVGQSLGVPQRRSSPLRHDVEQVPWDAPAMEQQTGAPGGQVAGDWQVEGELPEPEPLPVPPPVPPPVEGPEPDPVPDDGLEPEPLPDGGVDPEPLPVAEPVPDRDPEPVPEVTIVASCPASRPPASSEGTLVRPPIKVQPTPEPNEANPSTASTADFTKTPRVRTESASHRDPALAMRAQPPSRQYADQLHPWAVDPLHVMQLPEPHAPLTPPQSCVLFSP